MPQFAALTIGTSNDIDETDDRGTRYAESRSRDAAICCACVQSHTRECLRAEARSFDRTPGRIASMDCCDRGDGVTGLEVRATSRCALIHAGREASSSYCGERGGFVAHATAPGRRDRLAGDDHALAGL